MLMKISFGFRSNLGFKQHDITLNKEQSVKKDVMEGFPNEEISLQHNVSGGFIDLYFPKHKLAIEIDEKRHTDRPEIKGKTNTK